MRCHVMLILLIDLSLALSLVLSLGFSLDFGLGFVLLPFHCPPSAWLMSQGLHRLIQLVEGGGGPAGGEVGVEVLVDQGVVVLVVLGQPPDCAGEVPKHELEEQREGPPPELLLGGVPLIS